MADDQLVVFISSSMEELVDERKAVRSSLKKIQPFKPFAWEVDAGARNKSAQEVWRQKLEDTDVCVVLLWKKLGEWTLDEIEIALDLETPLLVYVKTNSEGAVNKKVEKYLSKVEDPAKGRLASAHFHSLKTLKKYISRDVLSLIKETFKDLKARKVAERNEVTGSGRKLEKSEGDHGWKSEEDKPQAAGRRNPDEMRRMARDRVPLVNRVDETGKARRAITSGEHFVALTGEPGFGKKAILRDLTHDEDWKVAFGDGAGINPEQSDGEDLEDILQATWEEFFETEELGQVEPSKRKRQLRGLTTLIILADVTLTTAEMEQLVEAMPKAAFILSVAGTTRAPGKRVAVGEFSDPDDVVRLFEARYHAPVPAKARSDVIELGESLGGNPGLVSLLADLAWDEAEAPDDGNDANHPLIEWASRYASQASQELVKALVSPDSAAAVDAARAVGVHVPGKVLSDTASTPAIEEGLADRALEAGSPRYRAAPALVDALNAGHKAEIDDTDLMRAILESGVDWAEAAGADEIFADRAFVARMLRWGALHEKWELVQRLGMATEEAFALGGRWGSWRVTLEHSLEASRQLGDEQTEAWALHQLGSRALVMDDLEEARCHLHHALEKRDRLGEDEAASVTRHNLGLVPLAVASIATFLLLLLGVAGWVAVEFGPTAWQKIITPPELTAIPDIDREVVLFAPEDESAAIRVTNLGTASFTIDEIVATPALEGTFNEGCIGFPIEPDTSCIFTVTATDARNEGFLDFVFSPVPAEDAGDDAPDLEVNGDTRVFIHYEDERG